MPDITMCNNEDCPLSWVCWRFNAPPNVPNQSYQTFEYELNDVDENVTCDFFIDYPDFNKTV